MAEERRGISLAQVALGAGIIAVAAVGVAAFVPRRRWAVVTEPLRGAMDWPVISAIALWAASIWNEAPRAPQFNDLRPFDEF